MVGGRRTAGFDISTYLLTMVSVDPISRCWNWLGSTASRGYGKVAFQGKRRQAHRVMAHLAGKLDIDSPLQGCHSCDNPACINPDHIFPGTPRDNMEDAIAKKRWTGTYKTHCYRGHEFSEANTYLDGRRRKCRKCAVIKAMAYYKRKKGQV